MNRLTRAVALAGGVLLLGGVAFAQLGGQLGGGQFGGGQFRGGGRRGAEMILPNTPYDGRFTFIRLRYGPPSGYAAQSVPWSHDYPTGERNFMRILDEVSFLGPHTEETNIMALDDPNLFKFPVAYMAEPGFWRITEAEAANFRSYLLKGGFVIFDDFSEQRACGPACWAAFEFAFRQVIPDARFVDLDPSHQIFHSFFEIDSFDIVPQAYDQGRPMFRGVYENNDPARRLIAMINYNTDISEYWEFSGTGLQPIEESNEAYKIGVNYIIYGMTH